MGRNSGGAGRKSGANPARNKRSKDPGDFGKKQGKSVIGDLGKRMDDKS